MESIAADLPAKLRLHRSHFNIHTAGPDERKILQIILRYVKCKSVKRNPMADCDA